MHDKFAPSKLDLIASCPGSANLAEFVPDKKSPHAERGTALHDVCRRVLSGEAVNEIPPEALWCLDRVTPYILDADKVLTEVALDLSHLGIVEPGTADVVIITDRSVRIYDYKFGRTPVNAFPTNRQMLAYASGVVRNQANGVDEVIVCILQPELERDAEYKIPIDGIPSIEDDIRRVINAAKDQNAPIVKGDHCYSKFCGAVDVCPLHRGAVMSIPRHMTVGQYVLDLTPVQRTKLYEQIRTARKWCEQAEEAIEGLALAGTIDLDGYAAVPSYGRRQWKDKHAICALFDKLEQERGITLFEPVSPAEAEKRTGMKFHLDTDTPETGRKLAAVRQQSEPAQPPTGIQDQTGGAPVEKPKRRGRPKKSEVVVFDTTESKSVQNAA